MQSVLPSWLAPLAQFILDGLAYDFIKYAAGALLMTGVLAALAKYKNYINGAREVTFVSIGMFVFLYVFIYYVAPRTQSPQLAGVIDSVVIGDLAQTEPSTIAVFSMSIFNSGAMQSTIKNWGVIATVSGRNYQGAFPVPLPQNIRFNMPNPKPGEPLGVEYLSSDNIVEKTITPVTQGGAVKGLLFIVFRGVDSTLFKGGADFTVGFEDVFSRRYYSTITSSAIMAPLTVTPGVRAQLMCPVTSQPVPQAPMSTRVQ